MGKLTIRVTVESGADNIVSNQIEFVNFTQSYVEAVASRISKIAKRYQETAKPVLP